MRHPYQSQLDDGLTPLGLALAVYRARNLAKGSLKLLREDRRITQYQPMGFWLPHKNQKYHPGSRGIWYPIPIEVRPCCWSINPMIGVKFGWTYHRHCRTLRHVAMLCNVDDRHLASELGIYDNRRHCECGKFRPKDDYLCRRCREIQDSLNKYQVALESQAC